MKTHSFETELWLKRPLDEVFAFFADARNLERRQAHGLPDHSRTDRQR